MQLGWVLFRFAVLHKSKYLRLYYQEKNYITMMLFCKRELKLVRMGVNVTKTNFSI